MNAPGLAARLKLTVTFLFHGSAILDKQNGRKRTGTTFIGYSVRYSIPYSGKFLQGLYFAFFCDLTKFASISHEFVNITIQMHNTSTQIMKLLLQNVCSSAKS